MVIVESEPRPGSRREVFGEGSLMRSKQLHGERAATLNRCQRSRNVVRQASNSGGRSDTDVTVDAVMPTGPSSL